MHAMDLVHTCNTMITNRHGGGRCSLALFIRVALTRRGCKRNNSSLIIQREFDISDILTMLIVSALQTPPLFIEGVPTGRGRYKHSA